MEDRDLITAIQNNNANAFELLVKTYYVPLSTFVNHIIQDGHSTEDIVQELFVKLWTDRAKLSSIIILKDYLYTSGRNAALNHLRSNKRRDSHYQHYMNQDDEEIETFYIEEETNRILYQAIKQLPPRSNQIMRLTLEGFKLEQIATELGISINTVKSLKYEALRKLRQHMENMIAIILFWSKKK